MIEKDRLRDQREGDHQSGEDLDAQGAQIGQGGKAFRHGQTSGLGPGRLPRLRVRMDLETARGTAHQRSGPFTGTRGASGGRRPRPRPLQTQTLTQREVSGRCAWDTRRRAGRDAGGRPAGCRRRVQPHHASLLTGVGRSCHSGRRHVPRAGSNGRGGHLAQGHSAADGCRWDHDRRDGRGSR